MTRARWTGERRLFQLGAVLLALHLADDGFVHPEPGTGAGDHVLSTGVPLLLVLASLGAHRIARPAVRASLALVLGLVALGIGVAVHVLQLQIGPFGGDHWSGLALLPGAAAFFVSAWRGLRLAPRRSKRRRALLVFGWLLVLYSFVIPVVAAWVLTHRPREDAHLRIGSPAAVRTVDGLELEARYVPSRNRAAVVLVPGREDYARMLMRHGYGVLLLEVRGRRGSEGDSNGWESDKDVDGAVRFLRMRADVDPERIGALGLSIGGEIALTAAAEGTPVQAVVSEGAGVRMPHEQFLRWDATTIVGLPLNSTVFGAVRVFSGDAPPGPLDRLVSRIAPRPIFLIESGHPQGGEDRNPIYYRRARQPKQYWRIPESKHTGGLEARPVEYERRVVGFFDRALLRG